jgi:hypothetical protein
VIPVNHTYTAAAMVQAGRDVEKVVLARAVKLVLEERCFCTAIEPSFSSSHAVSINVDLFFRALRNHRPFL